MNRSTPLKRHTPLVGSLKTHSEWQDRSRTRAAAKPRRQRNTGPTRATRDRLTARSDGRCELCARFLTPGVRQVHHRQPRGMGGSSNPAINQLSALLDLCVDCHLRRVENNRTWATRHGLLVPRPLIPCAVPADLLRGRRYLTDDGNYHDTQGAAA